MNDIARRGNVGLGGAALWGVLLLAGCAGSRSGPQWANTESRSVECAPYARSLTGLALSGAAYQWWDQAAGMYRRDGVPRVGAALVFQQSPRLPSGHVAVVARVLSDREILVDQANWVHGVVSHGDLVRDVSADNDWTLLRVWWRPTGTLGTYIYPAYGFIAPRAVAWRTQQPVQNLSLQLDAQGAICASSSTNLATAEAG